MVPYVHTPCRTVRYHESSFGSEGRTNTELIEAVDQDGSESRTTVVIERPSRLISEQTKNMTELVLREENRTLYIDHERRIFETHRGGANKGMPYWEEDDSQCSNMKSHFLYLSERIPDSVIAGVNVVGYRGRDYMGADYEVYFAPSLGCQQMRFQMVMRGFLGLKKEQYEMVVDSYEIGPPSPNLFTVPAGYTQVESILRP